MTTNVFVLGLDELNLETLQHLPGCESCRFHQLLSLDELLDLERVPFEELLARAEGQVRDFDGSVDAIVGYWDFPVSGLVPVLCDRLGLPGPSLEAVVKCEHKYWSRLEQRAVIDDHPPFGLVDLERAEVPDDVGYPMWLKPVKSTSSELAFHVHAEDELRAAVEEIREGIDRLGKPFEAVMAYVDPPEEVADVGGRACLAEEEVTGQQVTVEGYCVDGEVNVIGVIDSVTYPGTSSFWRYEYPSIAPDEVQRRMTDATERVMRRMGLGNGTFNVEYFWEDPGEGQEPVVNLLEINPRHSQSHAILFEHVDGVANHHVMVQLGLGRDPELPFRKGEYSAAAKWFHRTFRDGVVRWVPDADEVAAIERDVPGVTIDVVVEEGDRLSDMVAQDSYSYELADIFVGGRDSDDLRAKYERCVEALEIEIDEEE